MAYYPGQLVVCVDDASREGQPPSTLDGLKRGCVYTVRSVGDFKSPFEASARPCIWLEEIRRPVRPGDIFGESPYFASRFRPVQDSRLDVFRAVLAPTDRVPA